MMVSKATSLNLELNNFLQESFCDLFGVDVFNKWFTECSYFTNKKKLIIQVPNDDIAKYINQNFISDIANFCNAAWPNSGVKPIACTDLFNSEQFLLSLPEGSGIDNVTSIDVKSNYTFDDFVCDDVNRVAFDILSGVCGAKQGILKKGTLVYLTGDAGVGKTHLLRAAEHFSLQTKKTNICYMSAEVFSNKYVTAVRENKLSELRNSIIAFDALLIDDIGFISHRKSTVEELSSLIAIMLDSGRDVVIASTADISIFSSFNRLHSRLLGAVVIRVATASTELKRKLLVSLVTKNNINISTEIIDFLSNNITGGAREISGAVNRIRINFGDRNISIGAVKNMVSDLLIKHGDENNYGNDVSMIIHQVAEYYNLTVRDVCSPRAIKNNKLARSVAFLLCRDICNLTYVQIATEFKLSSHASVMNAVKKINAELQEDRALRSSVSIILENAKKYLH